MGSLDVPFHQVNGVSFSLYSSDEIRKLSVKEITNPVSLDALLHPTYGGLYDPSLGATEVGDVCRTCSQNYIHCPGHMGHINLPMPVYNPMLFTTLVKVIQGTCFNCRRLMENQCVLHAFQAKLRALDFGLISLVSEIDDKYNEVVGELTHTKLLDQKVVDAIDDILKKALEGKDEKDSFYTANVKNVLEFRQTLCKEFLGGGMRTTLCASCGFPSRALRTEHNVRVFFYKALNKETINKFLTKKIRIAQVHRKKKQMRRDPDEGDINEILIEEDELLDTTEMEERLKELEKMQYLTPMELKRHLRMVWANNSHVLCKVFKALDIQLTSDEADSPTDVFFFNVIPVPPSRFRPRASIGELKFDNAQTATYSKVLESSIQLRTILRDMNKKPDNNEAEEGIDNEDLQEKTDDKNTAKKGTEKENFEKLNSTWIKLQTSVNCIVDMNLDKLSTEKHPGIKQIIEKKEGLFRMNMMGKRVNYACRSVISPDPYINTNEIGIPLVFATKLTYPQPVTPWNFQKMKQAVINGPEIYPGATHIELENGVRKVLQAGDPTQREALAKQLLTPSEGKLGSKKVYRHLINGDVLLLNRQPTLHRPSMQAHRARVLGNERTLRLHYANCKAYNADFDGDEMNAHFPQDELARAEAYTIAATDYQYLVPKDGTPLAGLIQDHMVSGVTLTLRGRFFCRADYQQLVYRALTDKGGPIKYLAPVIRKPQVLWSGKQVLSTVLINIIPEGKRPLDLVGSAKISVRSWNNRPSRTWLAGGEPLVGNNMSESEVVISEGELLVGVLDKGHYGNTPYGLVHSCYELYGGQVAGRVLTCFAKLFTSFLQIHGFTLGVKDILCLAKADKERKVLMEESTTIGPSAAAKAFNMEGSEDDVEVLRQRYEDAHYSKEGELKDLDLAMKGKTDEINNRIAKAIIPNGLLKHFPENNLQLMVQSGAKGSSVNCMQISCLLGQIELEGRRPALMLNGKPLPSFAAYDMRPRASGFIAGRFLTGIRPQEYFFHCMAGREGLVDTAVKTSRSGYLQRCIIKHLEGVVVNYDQTVRDSDGSILQFQYGEDGLDITKTPFLQHKWFPFLITNQDQLISSTEEADIQQHTDSDLAPRLWKKLTKWKKKHSHHTGGIRKTAFLHFCEKKWPSVIEQQPQLELRMGRTEAAHTICNMWHELDDAKRAKYIKMGMRFPDPILSEVKSSHHLGIVSENYQDLVNDYINKNPDNLLKYNGEKCERWEISDERLQKLLYIRNLKAKVPAGEAVGLLAAQSIGEPSTQMTLNTFHFAGRGEMNVTLGIPRLREILMVASAAIKTPNMAVPILPGHATLAKARLLKKRLTKVHLSQVLVNLEVTETLSITKDKTAGRNRLYKLRFQFLPHTLYKDDMCLTPAHILQYMEKRFFIDLELSLRRKAEDLSRASLLKTASLKERTWTQAETPEATRKDLEQDEIEDDDLHDGDTVSDKRRQRQTQGRDYDGEEEEKAEVDGEVEDDEDSDVILTQNTENSGEDEERVGVEKNFSFVDTPKSNKRRRSSSSKRMSDSSSKKMSDARINFVMTSVKGAVGYMYDPEEELSCEITLSTPLSAQKLDMTSVVESAAGKAVVYETPGISRCFLTEPKEDGTPGKLTMEGINLRELHKYQDCLDLKNLYTNDIHAVSKVYGVEAGSRAIIKEVRDVFAAYGIGVDYRHLSLVADYMTFEGEYKAFNRLGINSNPSPFQKMSFETTMAFLKTATISGAHDDLTSPSSRIIVGRTVMCGTGSFDVLQPV